MSDPLVSIVIPCWGCRGYIVETIRSALAQNYQPLEVVVVEDAGSDGTYEAAAQLRDDRLRVLRNEVNLGQHRNKNRGLELARGSLIKYLDGDDLLEPDCVERLVRAWQEAGPGVGVVFGQYGHIDHHGRTLTPPRHWGVRGRFHGRDVLEAVLGGKPGGSMFGNVTPHLFDGDMLRSVGGFPEQNSYVGDLEAFLKLLCVADVVFVPEIVAHYRRQPGSISSTTRQASIASDTLDTIDRLEAFFRDRGVPPQWVDPEFIARWKLESCTRFIVPHYIRWMLGRENQFEALRQLYERHGLEKRLNRFARARTPGYIWQMCSMKVRQALGMRGMPPLFNRHQRRTMRRSQPRSAGSAGRGATVDRASAAAGADAVKATGRMSTTRETQ